MGIIMVHLNQIVAGLELAPESHFLLPPWGRAASEEVQAKGRP